MNAKQNLLENSGFKCQKCGYYSPLGKGIEINKIHKAVLCSVCNTFAPDSKTEFENYLKDKADWNALESFRKFGRKTRENLKRAMVETAQKGRIVSRPAFGYKIERGLLIPAENNGKVREIFESFIKGSSLNQIAKAHMLSVNGIKKILRNFTYIGKVKFDNKITQGEHQPIISTELFNEVQRKFEEKIHNSGLSK